MTHVRKLAAHRFALAIILGAGLVGYGILKINAQQADIAKVAKVAAVTAAQLKASVDNQLANRVANVAAWCGEEVAIITYDTAFVRKFHVNIPYTLQPPDCAAIEKATRMSAQPKKAV